MTDLERAPSTDGTPSMHTASLNKSPDPHSIVERLLTRAQSRCDKDRALGDSSIMTPENYLEWQAATIISELQAELGYKNNAISEYILGDDNSELARAKASEAYMGGALGRELELHEQTRQQLAAAESALSRIQSETVELRRAAIAVCWFDWSNNDSDAVEAIDRLGKAIRSSLTDVGEAKTAESLDSPSTQNTETE